jgi:hypothetical protein
MDGAGDKPVQNWAGGVMGKPGKEGDVFRRVLPHSIVLAAIVGRTTVRSGSRMDGAGDKPSEHEPGGNLRAAHVRAIGEAG